MAARSASLVAAVAGCMAATLLHHIHNAEFLRDYPNLPPSLTRGGVYAAWLAEAAIAVAGLLLLKFNYTRLALAALGLYALFAFGGLAHYYAAPLSAHTLAMNVTIWLEAVTAALLLAAVLRKWQALRSGATA